MPVVTGQREWSIRAQNDQITGTPDTELGFDEGLDSVDLPDRITVASIGKDDFDPSS